MKALPPPSPQLELAICRSRSLMVLDREARNEIVRALAEILLIAADAAAVQVRATLAEEEHEPR